MSEAKRDAVAFKVALATARSTADTFDLQPVVAEVDQLALSEHLECIDESDDYDELVKTMADAKLPTPGGGTIGPIKQVLKAHFIMQAWTKGHRESNWMQNIKKR